MRSAVCRRNNKINKAGHHFYIAKIEGRGGVKVQTTWCVKRTKLIYFFTPHEVCTFAPLSSGFGNVKKPGACRNILQWGPNLGPLKKHKTCHAKGGPQGLPAVFLVLARTGY
jgi:hypothetical protein